MSVCVCMYVCTCTPTCNTAELVSHVVDILFLISFWICKSVGSLSSWSDCCLNVWHLRNSSHVYRFKSSIASTNQRERVLFGLFVVYNLFVCTCTVSRNHLLTRLSSRIYCFESQIDSTSQRDTGSLLFCLLWQRSRDSFATLQLRSKRGWLRWWEEP